MSLITYNGLVELVEQGVIQGVEHGQINAASIDITLGDTFLVEAVDWDADGRDLVSLRRRDKPKFIEHTGKILLRPGAFCLAQTREVFNLPNNIAAEYKLKSSMARIGLEHLNAGWCDPGWNGSVLTLELVNLLLDHDIELEAGTAIGQIVFFRGEPVPDDRSYAARGRYNGDSKVMPIKP